MLGALLGLVLLAQTTAPVPGHQPVSGYVGAKITDGGGYANVTGTSLDVNCTAGCSGAAGAATVSTNYQWSGTAWVRVVGDETNGTKVQVTGSVATTGPLTDAQLRATAVPVSGPLTDAQLRAATVPVSGTVTVTDGAGALNVIVDSGTTAITGSVAVTGPLTDAQLRATAVPVSGTVTANAGSGTFVVGDGAGALNTIIDSGAVTVSGTATVTISQTTTANDVDVLTMPTVTVTDGAGALNVIVDSGTLTAVTSITNAVTVSQATAANLNAEIQGDAAHAAVTSGNPILDGAYAEADAAALDSASVVEGDITRLKANIEGQLLVRADHPNRFVCTVLSTATTTTSVTGCTTPGAGLSRYITDVRMSNSAADGVLPSLLQYGTGAACATGTTVVYRCSSPASGSCGGSFATPIKLAANTDLCFVAGTAGTKAITVQGFIAP